MTHVRLKVRIADFREAAGPQGFAAFFCGSHFAVRIANFANLVRANGLTVVLFVGNWGVSLREPPVAVLSGSGLSFQSLAPSPLPGRRFQRISISVPHAKRRKNRVRVNHTVLPSKEMFHVCSEVMTE